MRRAGARCEATHRADGAAARWGHRALPQRDTSVGARGAGVRGARRGTRSVSVECAGVGVGGAGHVGDECRLKKKSWERLVCKLALTVIRFFGMILVSLRPSKFSFGVYSIVQPNLQYLLCLTLHPICAKG